MEIIYIYIKKTNLFLLSDDIVMLLAKAAIKKKWFKRAFDVSSNSVRMFPDTGEVARIFIEHFRKGSFGSVMLDRDILELDIS